MSDLDFDDLNDRQKQVAFCLLISIAISLWRAVALHWDPERAEEILSSLQKEALMELSNLQAMASASNGLIADDVIATNFLKGQIELLLDNQQRHWP
jgi:hypothetical protein